MLKKPTPGLRTRKNLLLTAMAPMGTTLYIYGGGWNREDTGASDEARRIGTSPYWKEFFRSKDEHYRYRDDADPIHSYYPYDGLNRYSHLGLDCSGYMGWVLYNVLCHQSGEPGYVVEASKGAKMFAEGFGLGRWCRRSDYELNFFLDTTQCRPGDIISMDGHIWMFLGRCEDGSILIAHSSVIKSRTGEMGGGVQLGVLNPGKSGEKAGCLSDTENREEPCLAWKLADEFVKKHFPEWYRRYSVTIKPWQEYLLLWEQNRDTGIFYWDDHVLSDPDGIGFMSPEELLTSLTKK